MTQHIQITMKRNHRGAPPGKFLVTWFYEGQLVYADVSCGLPPADDFDTFAHKMEKKLGHADFYGSTTVLYAAEISAEGMTADQAHKAAADLIIAELDPPAAKRKARAPEGVVVTLSGDWPADQPATVGGGEALAGTDDDPHADFLRQRCRGQVPPKALTVLLDEHADTGSCFLTHPATFELELDQPVEQDDERVCWFAASHGFRLGFWVAGEVPIAEAPLILEDSEGGTRSVGRSIEEFVLLYASYDGSARVEAAQAWFAAHGLTCERSAEAIGADLPEVG